jgi:hypothetical protein
MPRQQDLGPGPLPTQDSAFLLTIKPWTTVASPEQARMLTTTGVVSFAILAVFGVLAFFSVNEVGPLGLIGGAVYAVCAVGTSRNVRPAAYIGLGLTVIVLLVLVFQSPALLILTIPATLGALAGVRGVRKGGGRKPPSSL